MRRLAAFAASVIVVGASIASAGSQSADGRDGACAVPSTTAGPAKANCEHSAREVVAASGPGVNIDAYKACANPSNYIIPAAPASAYVDGYSTATKVGEALPTGFPVPALATSESPDEGIRATGLTVDGTRLDCFLVTLELDYQGRQEFPPARGTFMAFGTVPVTATVELTQAGTAPVTGVLYGPATSAGVIPFQEISTAEVALQVSDVAVNGVPLDVGPDCHTVGPVFTPDPVIDPDDDLVVLTGGASPGDPQPFLNGLTGGALDGTVTIPSFTGCTGRDGENLDALLTAAISGPGNDVRIDQGGLCQAPAFCVPGAGNTPAIVPSFTVSKGGSYTGTANAPLVLDDRLANRTGVVITCSSSHIGGTIPNSAGPPRGQQATLAWTSISDCVGTDTVFEVVNGTRQLVTTPFGDWTVVPGVAPTPAFYTVQDGIVTWTLWSMSFELAGTNLPGTAGSCSVNLSGGENTTYDESDSTFATAAGGAAALSEANNTCTAISKTVLPKLSFSYLLDRPVSIASP